MIQEYEDLKAKIAATPDAFVSNVELVMGLANLFLARADDPGAIRELAAKVTGQALDLVKTVNANTAP